MGAGLKNIGGVFRHLNQPGAWLDAFAFSAYAAITSDILVRMAIEPWAQAHSPLALIAAAGETVAGVLGATMVGGGGAEIADDLKIRFKRATQLAQREPVPALREAAR